MTIILLKRATETIDLPGGLTLTVKVADAATFELAQNIAKGDAARIMAGKAEAAAYGLDGAAFGDDVDPPLEAMIAIALGRLTVTAWVGVGASETEPAPADAANIALVFKEWAAPGVSYGQLFWLKMSTLRTLERGAKNVSTVSPDTSTGEAGKAAGTASLPESAGPATP